MTTREGYDLLQSDPKWQKYTAEGKEATKKLVWALDKRLQRESKILGNSHYEKYKSDPDYKVGIMGFYFFKWLGQYAKWYPGAHIKKPTAITTVFIDKDIRVRVLSNSLCNPKFTIYMLKHGLKHQKKTARAMLIKQIKDYFYKEKK